MTTSDDSSELDAQRHALCAAALDFQRTDRVLRYWKHNKPHSTFIPILCARQARNFHSMWTVVKGPLMGTAGRWRTHHILDWHHDIWQDPLEDTAVSLFSEILDVHLPRLTIDPQRNLLGWMTVTAWRSLMKKERDSPTGELELFSTIERNENHGEIVDPEGDDFADRVLGQHGAKEIIRQVFELWHRTLRPADVQLMMIWLGGEIKLDCQQIEELFGQGRSVELLRQMTHWFSGTGKRSSQQIAEVMGRGCSADTVRQRRSHIISETKEYLFGHGVMEFNDLDDIQLDRHIVATLTDPRNAIELHRFLKSLRPIERQIMSFCLCSKPTLRYVEIAEKLGPRWRVSQVRDWVGRLVAKARLHFRACGLEL